MPLHLFRAKRSAAVPMMNFSAGQSSGTSPKKEAALDRAATQDGKPIQAQSRM
jgi:hypothetical protein